MKLDLDHSLGCSECGSCWVEYPKPCACGGLVHAEFGDYYVGNGDNYYLEKACDRCDDPQETV